MTLFRSLALVCLSFVVGLTPLGALAQSYFELASVDNELPNAPLPHLGSVSSTYSSSQQQPGTVQEDTSAKPSDQNHKVSSEEQLKAEEKQRMLGVVPSFNAVMSGTADPLTSKQKFDLWFHSATDPFTFVAAGLDAAIEQGQDEYPAYGQGFVGYAKRYGASYTDSVDGNLWGNAILPSLLHQDPRYFRLGHGSFSKRAIYTLLSTVRCKGDNGKWQPSYSNVGGNFIAGAISNIYYPAADRGVGLTLERGFTVTAEGAIGSFAFEFYPDAIAYLKRRHHTK